MSSAGEVNAKSPGREGAEATTGGSKKRDNVAFCHWCGGFGVVGNARCGCWQEADALRAEADRKKADEGWFVCEVCAEPFYRPNRRASYASGKPRNCGEINCRREFGRRMALARFADKAVVNLDNLEKKEVK